ncbi:MAG: hypothetical protein LBN74_00770 [Prevotella sp.]|jgi:hypothetical protein|nr:hypothetical protein [Prevotella sp.]
MEKQQATEKENKPLRIIVDTDESAVNVRDCMDKLWGDTTIVELGDNVDPSRIRKPCQEEKGDLSAKEPKQEEPKPEPPKPEETKTEPPKMEPSKPVPPKPPVAPVNSGSKIAPPGWKIL